MDSEAGEVAAPLVAPRLGAARRRGKGGAAGQALDAGLRKLKPRRHVECDLDRGAGEVQIRSVEHAQLDHGGYGWFSFFPASSRWSCASATVSWSRSSRRR